MVNKVIPVALFTYARPEHLQRTLNALRINKIPMIYAFSDGPKTEEKKSDVEAVRQILRNVDWCDIRIIERDTNFGLGRSIRSGVDDVFKDFDKVIIIEDDIVLRPGSYEYTARALFHYENDPKVMTVSMWSHPIIVPDNAKKGFFSKRFVCWGWGTYRDEWNKYVETPGELYKKCLDNNIDVLSWGKDIKWQIQNAEKRNLWYVGYVLVHLLYDKVSYFPNESLVINYGKDASGENTGWGIEDDYSIQGKPIKLPEEWPDVYVPPNLNLKFKEYFDPKKKTVLQKLRIFGGKVKRKIWRNKYRNE